MRDQGYLASLNRPNVQLTFEHIAHVEPDCIVTEAGAYVCSIGGRALTNTRRI